MKKIYFSYRQYIFLIKTNILEAHRLSSRGKNKSIFRKYYYRIDIASFVVDQSGTKAPFYYASGTFT